MRNDLMERTFEFAVRVVSLCRTLDKSPGVSRTLARQLLRSGTSIVANIEEGQPSQSKADFIDETNQLIAILTTIIRKTKAQGVIVSLFSIHTSHFPIPVLSR